MRINTLLPLLAALALTACSSEPPPPVATAPTLAPAEPVVDASDVEPQARDEAYFLARHPELATREGLLLTLRLAGGRQLKFEDNPETGEEWEITEFLGPVEGRPYLLLLRGFLEAGHYLLVNIDSGEQARLDSQPLFSPDGQWLLTSSIDLDAGFFPNRTAIFRVTATAALLEWELDGFDGPWGPEDARWVDTQTVAYTRVSQYWRDDGTELRARSEQTVRLVDGAWVHD